MNFIKNIKELIKKELSKADKILFVLVLLILIFGVFMYMTKTEKDSKGDNKDNKYIMVDGKIREFGKMEEVAKVAEVEKVLDTETEEVKDILGKDTKVYLGDVYDKCPYYQPDGVGFKKCLYDLLDEQKVALDEQVNVLIKDLIEKDKQSEIRMLLRISEYVTNYKKSWDLYYKEKCEFDSMDSMYGTANSSDIMACEIREIQELSKKFSEVNKTYNRNYSEGVIAE